MNRLEALADAIQWYEGWKMGSISWRNNKPGNLRWSRFANGTRANFATFNSYIVGWIALWYDLHMKCLGKTRTGLNGNSTLLALFNVWAPSSDGNDPDAYARAVARRLKIPATTPLRWFLEGKKHDR